MAIVSDIEIRLAANIAALRQDMEQARRTVGGAMDGIRDSVNTATKALGALAVGMAAGAFAGWIKGAIDATDAVSDISQRTGIAIKDIAGLQMWFQKGGTEAKTFESAMVKLSKKIADGGKEFDNLGIKTRDANGNLRGNVEVLLDSADAFAAMQDGTAKTAAAVGLFGEEGAKLIPLLNEGSGGLREMNEMAEKLGLTFDENTVEAAGKFNDTLDLMGAASQGVARQVAAQLLPTLNTLTGSMFEFITAGNGVQNAAAVIGTGFKLIYTAGVLVTQAFNVMGKTVGMLAAQIASLFQMEFKQAMNIGHAWQADMKDVFSSTAKTIGDTWSGAGGEVVQALAATSHAGTIAAASSDKAAKAAKQQAEAYRSLIDAIQGKITESDREAMGVAKLTESQKLAMSLDEGLASGKVKLTAAEEGYYRMLIETLGASEQAAEMNKEVAASNARAAKGAEDLAKFMKQVAAEREKDVETAIREADAQEELARTFGMTKTALAELAVARAQDNVERAKSEGLDYDEMARLRKLVEEKQRAAVAIAKVEDLEQQRDLWKSIEETAHDTFVSIIDGGKDAATRLKDTFKNVFFDWLYQQTLKKWIINLSGTASLSTAAGAASAAGGATGGLSGSVASIGGIAGLIGSAGAIGVGGLQTAGALLAGHIGLGSTISAGVSALATGTAAGVSAGLASLAGTLGPIALGVFGAVKLLDKAFGRGPKTTTATGISGTFGADSFSGQNFTEWMKKGGWFSSTKRGTDTSALSAEMSATLNEAYAAIKDSTGAFAAALGVPADVVTSYSKTIKLAFSGDAAKDQQALTDLFTQMGDELAGRVLPNVAQFIKEGETAASALQRLATEFTVIDTWLQSLGLTSSQAFGAVGTASLEARDRLITLAGGLESFVSQVDFFNANFLSDAERMAPTIKAVAEQMAALGFAGITTTDQFKAAAQELAASGALATEAGAKQYAGLLALAPAFKQVTDYTMQLAAAQAQAAKDAQDAADAEKALAEERAAAAAAAEVDRLKTAAGDTFAALQRSVNAERAVVQKAFSDMMAKIGASIEAQQAKVNKLQGLSQALGNTTVGGLTADRGAAQAQIAAALAIARSTGYLPDADTLKDALSVVSQDAQDQFSSFVDYQRDALLTQNSIEELAGLTDTELTLAQRTLEALNEQKTAQQAAFDREMMKYDEMLAKAQGQLDAINGVRTDVLSLVSAFQQFASSIGAALSNPAVGGQPSVSNPTVGSRPSVSNRTQVEALYNSLLGRTSDSAGLEFQLQKMAEGYTLDMIRQGIVNSAEYQAMNQQIYTPQQSGRMMTSGTEQQQINADMQAALNRTASAVEKMADQIDQVTGGGNAMLVESM